MQGRQGAINVPQKQKKAELIAQPSFHQSLLLLTFYLPISLNHEIAGKSLKTGVRAKARTPVLRYTF
jgi:hypothetical protein